MADKKKEVKKDALTAPTYQEKGTGLVRLNMNAFEPALKKEIITLVGEIGKDYSDIARSHLKIGKSLSQARLLLEARGERIFTAFLNEIPGMSNATAYRYINAWEHARTVFPEQILIKILAANLPMLGGPDQKFGKYTDVVVEKKMDVELDKMVREGKVTEEYAEDWIKRVQYAKTLAHGQKTGKGAKVIDPTILQEEAFASIRRRYNKLPKGKKTVAWLTNLFAYTLHACGFASAVNIDPRKPPKDWEGQATEDEQKTAQEGKANGKEKDSAEA